MIDKPEDLRELARSTGIATREDGSLYREHPTGWNVEPEQPRNEPAPEFHLPWGRTGR